MSTMPKMRAETVLTAVRKHYGLHYTENLMPEWSGLKEFSLGPGGGRRRADLFLVRGWSGGRGHERITIEIKVSRADLRQELANPHKISPFTQVSHRVYFATPAGLIKDTDNFPKEFGILEVQDDGTVKQRKRAIRNATPAPIEEKVFVEAFRRAGRLEGRMEFNDPDDLNAKMAVQSAQIKSLESKLERLLAKQERLKYDAISRHHFIKRALDAGVLCKCGQQLEFSMVGTKERLVHKETWIDRGDYRSPACFQI